MFTCTCVYLDQILTFVCLVNSKYFLPCHFSAKRYGYLPFILFSCIFFLISSLTIHWADLERIILVKPLGMLYTHVTIPCTRIGLFLEVFVTIEFFSLQFNILTFCFRLIFISCLLNQR